jgi:uncharacterized protein (TIGR00369 family)
MTTQTGNPILAFLQAHIGLEMQQSPSPVSRWLNGTLRVATLGDITADYIVRENMTNPNTTLHGGISAAIADDIIGVAVYSLHTEYYYTTVNLTMDYLAPAKVGQVVRARGWVVRQGRTIIHTECTIHNLDGQLLARGTSNLCVTSAKMPGR